MARAAANPKHAHTYRVVSEGGDEHHVVVVFDGRPDVWRRVATFPSRDRACDYAEMENHLVEHFPEDPCRYEAGEGPADAPAVESRLKPALLAASGSAALAAPERRGGNNHVAPERRGGNNHVAPERRGGNNHVAPEVDAEIRERLAAGASTRQITAETGVAKNTVLARRTELVVDGVLQAHPEKAPKDGPQRGPGRAPVPAEEMEERVQRVLAAIKALASAGAKLSYPTVAAKAGLPHGSVAAAIAALKERGLIAVYSHGQMPAEELRSKGGIRLLAREAQALAAPVPTAPAAAAERAPSPAPDPAPDPAPSRLPEFKAPIPIEVDLNTDSARIPGFGTLALDPEEAELLYLLLRDYGDQPARAAELLGPLYGACRPKDPAGDILRLAKGLRHKLGSTDFDLAIEAAGVYRLCRREQPEEKGNEDG